MIAFLIPVRHPDSVDDYDATWELLNQTLLSLSRQDNIQWQAIICANKVLPVRKELPHGQLTFLEHNGGYRGEGIDQHLIDKAAKRQIAFEFVEPLKPEWCFMLDADDLVSPNLVSNMYMTAQPQHRFVNVTKGLVVDTERGRYKHTDDLNIICGSTVAIRPQVIREHSNDARELVLLLAQHNFEKYHKSMCPLHYQRHTLSLPLVAYIHHGSNYARDLWNHREFDGMEISAKVREEFQISD